MYFFLSQPIFCNYWWHSLTIAHFREAGLWMQKIYALFQYEKKVVSISFYPVLRCSRENPEILISILLNNQHLPFSQSF